MNAKGQNLVQQVGEGRTESRRQTGRPIRLGSSSVEIPLSRNAWVRQFHRWLSIAFTAAVIANFVAMGLGQPPAWVVYSPLLPLSLLLFTGMYMFVLPYAAKWRSG